DGEPRLADQTAQGLGTPHPAWAVVGVVHDRRGYTADTALAKRSGVGASATATTPAPAARSAAAVVSPIATNAAEIRRIACSASSAATCDGANTAQIAAVRSRSAAR